MKVIVGLGNPGREYEKTRHNAGAMCVDAFFAANCAANNFSNWKLSKKFKALISEGNLNGEKIILAKPQTFMNVSGEAVQSLVHFYNVPLADLWLIYDDVDLPLGKLRIRPDGAPGTHNGMKSVTQMLGTQNFPRIRIGIESRGHSAAKEQDISSFVLHQFSKDEAPVIAKAAKDAALALKKALKEGIPTAQENFN